MKFDVGFGSKVIRNSCFNEKTYSKTYQFSSHFFNACSVEVLLIFYIIFLFCSDLN